MINLIVVLRTLNECCSGNQLRSRANLTSSSAMAEGPRDALVSRNSAAKISLSYGIICVILSLAVFTQYRSVTDTHTHRDTSPDLQLTGDHSRG